LIVIDENVIVVVNNKYTFIGSSSDRLNRNTNNGVNRNSDPHRRKNTQ